MAFVVVSNRVNRRTDAEDVGKKPKKPKKKNMAVVVVTNSNNRRNAAESTTGWASDGGGGAGPQNEPDFFYQGTQSVSRKVGTTLGGFAFTDSVTTDWFLGTEVVGLFKLLWTNHANASAAPSCRLKIGQTTSDYIAWQFIDDGSYGDIDSRPAKLWHTELVRVADTGAAAWYDTSGGNANLNIADVYGIQGDFGSASKSENVCMDAIDFTPGLWLVGGDSTDPDGTMLDFKAHDEDTQGNRFGHYVTFEGNIILQGKFVIGRNASGTVTATVFTDSNRNITFPNNRVGEADNQFEFDLGNASTVITISAFVITSQGRSAIKRWWDTSADQVDAANDELDITAHGFATGDYVIYSAEGGTENTGLVSTNNADYYVRAVTADSIALYESGAGATPFRSAAYNDTNRVNLTAAGTGQQHSITRRPITWPDYLVTGNTGSLTFENCTFNGVGTMTLTSGATIDTCVFNGVHLIDMASGATIDACTFNDQITTEGVALIETPDPGDIINSTFVASGEGGHAIEVEATGTFNLDNITFTGYGPVASEFNASTDVDAINDEIDITGHPWTTEDAIYYNDRGGTAITGLTDQTRYYVRSITANAISLYNTRADAAANTNKIGLTAGSSETHAIESADAAVLNSSGGAVTLDVINGGTVPSVRNTAGSSTTVNNSVTVTVQGLTEGSAVTVHANETVGTVTIGDELASGFANNAGVFSYSQNYEAAFGAGLDVTVRARNQGIATAAILDDNGVFTDLTSEANSTVTNDLTLLPATPVVNQDSIQFGHDEEFGQMRFFMTTAGTGGFGITWEYWNGTIWTALSGVSDATSNFSLTGERIVSWTIPGDWATRTDNSQGPFKYVRARYTSGTVTIVPLARRVTLDVTRYIPFVQNNTITSTGLTVTASWIVDSIGKF